MLYRWERLTEHGGLRWLKYPFSLGTANTLAVRLGDGSWLVVAPARGAPAEVFDELERECPVSALLAPNAFHHLGQVEWRARFPHATSYAPEGALPRLTTKSPVPYRPLAELTRKLPEEVSIHLPDGMKLPDVFVHAAVEGQVAWFTGDLVTNTTKDDQPWVVRTLAPLFGSGLGYRCNSKPELVYVSDRTAWKRSIALAVERCPPTIVVPAHGDTVTEKAAEQTRTLFAN